VPRRKTCIKCGASLERKNRISITRIHLSALILGIIGLSLLTYGYIDANRIYPINTITPAMEGKNVIIAGTVVDMQYDDRYEKTSFTVNDSTGSISFYGWSDFTSALKERGVYPSIGDNITVEGVVDVYNSSYSGLITSLEVPNANTFKVIYVKPQLMNISDILKNHIGKKVCVRGNITDKYISKSGLEVNFMTYDLTDNSGTIEIFIPGDLIAITGSDSTVYPNVTQSVEITGMVSIYKEQLEIIPSNATNSAIKILEEWL
ncbi:MAG: hypothetical protein ACTSVC_16755, partial [Promethearchaeota archaeon]